VPIPYRYTGPLKPENKYGYQPAAEGDGINAATGNYTYSNVDLSVPGRGIPLTINRSYNSLDTSFVSPFGYVVASRAICQWNSSRQWQLEVDISRTA